MIQYDCSNVCSNNNKSKLEGLPRRKHVLGEPEAITGLTWDHKML